MLPKIRLKPTPYAAKTRPGRPATSCRANPRTRPRGGTRGSPPSRRSAGAPSRCSSVLAIVPIARATRAAGSEWSGGRAQEDNRRDVLPDVVGAQRVTTPRSTREERSRDAPETADDGDDQPKVVSSNPALTVSGPLIDWVIATIPASAPLSAKMTCGRTRGRCRRAARRSRPG